MSEKSVNPPGTTSNQGGIKTILGQLKWDFGIRLLLNEWKLLFSPTHLKNDIISGATVTCVAIPLSLAIALASGVEPAVGLTTAIVAGIVCGLFGGTPLAVSGPAAAMAVLIATVVQNDGVSGLLVVGFFCGILQCLTGIFRLGGLVRYIPLPVVAGFTAGIGAIIFIGQLTRALGLPPPDQSHVLSVLTHIKDLLHQTQEVSLILATTTVAIIFILPHFFPRLPAPLIAVAIPTLAAAILKLDVQTIGQIPTSLPAPRMPKFPSENILNLLGNGFIVYALASLETLLSSSAVDKLSKSHRHNPDQELIGQGLGNIATSLFGGIPVTGVIARSALNVQSGAKTRRSTILHAFGLLGTVFFFAPYLSAIPISVLAGVLLAVALRMLHPHELIQLWKTSRGEGLVYLVTFFVIVFVDLIVGVQAGVVAALIITAIRFGKTKANVYIFDHQGPSVISVNGSLTFMSHSQIEQIRNNMHLFSPTQGLVLDFSSVQTLDATGADQLMEVVNELHNNGIRVAIKGVSKECREVMQTVDQEGKLTSLLAFSEQDVAHILGQDSAPFGMGRLLYGVERFQRELKEGYRSLFQSLAESQTPHTLLITCSDSRINPNLITSTDPGELFIVRNVGNIIPQFGLDATPAEGAAVEFAIGVLGVKEIVVCAHSGCGAMKALLSTDFFSPENQKKFPSLSKWLEVAEALKRQLPKNATPDQMAELNCVHQLESLKTYPIIQEKLAAGEIRLHAWFYDIGEAELEEWDPEKKIFVTIGSQEKDYLTKRSESGVQFQAPV